MNNEFGITLCSDKEVLLKFCHQAPIRYRHLISDITIPYPEWRMAFRQFYGVSLTEQPVFYVDDPQNTAFFAAVFLNRLRIEGAFEGSALEAFTKWCREKSFQGYATTDEKLMCILRSVTGSEGWSYNLHYRVTLETFHDCTVAEVRLLTDEDRPQFEAFLTRPADVPFLTIGRTAPGLERDYYLAGLNLPVHCYAAYVENKIIGAVTVHPMTTYTDELSQIYVAPEFRGRGIGYSLMSAAVKGAFARNRVLAAATNSDTLLQFKKIGFRFECKFWHQRYWHDTPQNQSGIKESKSL